MNRVTAGLPGLLPARRLRIARREQARELARQAILDEYGQVARTVAPDGDADTTVLLQQLGRPMSNVEFWRRLRLLNHNLHVEPSLGDSTKQVIFALEHQRTATGGWEMVKRYVCGMEAAEVMPEFSVRHTKEKLIPDVTVPGQWGKVKAFAGETRGWRTVLARLLRDGLISLEVTERLFDISGGRPSKNWHVLTN